MHLFSSQERSWGQSTCDLHPLTQVTPRQNSPELQSESVLQISWHRLDTHNSPGWQLPSALQTACRCEEMYFFNTGCPKNTSKEMAHAQKNTFSMQRTPQVYELYKQMGR